MTNLELRPFQTSAAVCLRKANKDYGTKHVPIVVLRDLSMTVPTGIIYSLLGASGCGKTTLLSCIVGQRCLDSGDIYVLGKVPNSKNSSIPGPRLGYMPQKISLYNEFSIQETMKYFGWLANMSTPEIGERLSLLANLLALPAINQKIKYLSGGQQRRVSLATALLHEPKLLVLDEPTVGLDPILRDNIWSYLINMVKETQTTIILTSHYIDEAKQADVIGLMRGGCLMAEASPTILLERFNVESLDEVFLKLSIMQNSIQEARSDLDTSMPDFPPLYDLEEMSSSVTNHMKALIWKNTLWMLKNFPIMCSILALPAVVIVLFYMCIGNDPKHLNIAVINRENNNNNTYCKTVTCDSAQLSCNYFQYLENSSLNLIYYDSEVAAQNSVLIGKTYAFIAVQHNFTQALKVRLAELQRTKEWDLEFSTISVFRDVSVKSIARLLMSNLYESFNQLLGDYIESCNGSRRGVTPPIKMNTIYGLEKPSYTEFISPGLMTIIAFYVPLGLAAGAILIERTEGILERSLVMGINLIELLLSHLVCVFVIMIIQTGTMLATTFFIFNATLNGSIVLIVFLTYLTGLCGICAGMTVSMMCDTETTTGYIIIGSLVTVFFIAGIAWPIEGMYYILRPIALFLPFPFIVDSMRSVMQKGWGINNFTVYLGFIHAILWTLIFLIVAIIATKFRTR